MIFTHIDLLSDDPLIFLTLMAATAFALLVGIGFHEFCHAFMADSLGDTLPASQGRVTLNPMAHLDPAGTAMMIIVGFGWGKPVQFNPYGLKVRPKTAMLLVSLAGPMSNFVAAGLLGIPIKMGWVPYFNPLADIPSSIFSLQVQTTEEYIGLFLSGAVILNVILGVFNLIPIHPLDGFKVVLGLLPDDLSNEFAKLARFGPGMLLTLIALPLLTGWSPLSRIMYPAARWLIHLFTGV